MQVIIRKVEQLLSSLGNDEQVETVLLIGGATRIPLVRESLNALKLKLASGHLRDVAVGQGAALFGRPTATKRLEGKPSLNRSGVAAIVGAAIGGVVGITSALQGLKPEEPR